MQNHFKFMNLDQISALAVGYFEMNLRQRLLFYHARHFVEKFLTLINNGKRWKFA